MKVAVLSSIAWRTPPERYGPWEQIASNLTEGLVESGIDVTLFATGNSKTGGKLQWVCEKPYVEDAEADAKVNECLHISHLFQHAAEFDIIHNHFDFLPLTFSSFTHTPVLTTIHGFSSPRIVPVYEKYNTTTYYASISNANRHPALTYAGTVYNGINTNAFSFVDKPEDYLLFFGRIHPEKGAKEAIAIAAQAGRKLIIAGLIQDQEYFNAQVQPFLNDYSVIYAGNCDPIQRNALLGRAAALLHPISFEEPFGLSVVEAMCCGTPVIAFNRGSMPELVQPSVNGFLALDINEAVEGVEKITSINRKACRQTVLDTFSSQRMTSEYLKLYTKIIESRS